MGNIESSINSLEFGGSDDGNKTIEMIDEYLKQLNNIELELNEIKRKLLDE